ncbi:4-hydroxythreonine-4-phosphate dehydrogenase PdxA [Saliphagus infecundisoli]|uniref:4-hydroxythreonine-4-phosphate dehydrogenase PdxA n=1 Tax=Saliphagus infecundisoli TaxID=1849069 RepID=A0ABD5QKC1_9EURY|nr:4-hydroxythreonine-4-phosphate dehydrogenase PdxA [Saliphagus infecundisoli]
MGAVDMDRYTVALTMGDPAGVGSEVIVTAWPELFEDGRTMPLVVGDAGVLRAAVENCGVSPEIVPVDRPAEAADVGGPDTVPVIDLANVDGLEYGVVREAYGRASLDYVERAIDLALAGEIDAMTTAPINKQATRLAGSDHAGHTGMLADRTDTDSYAMLLIEGDLRVSHVTTHVPLAEACELVTRESVLETIRVTDEALRELGIAEPGIAVAGLNPHASDGGLLGETEREEIEPAISAASEEGIAVAGPESPDTVYPAAAGGAADCVVSMYHDQGHIPIKMLGFAEGGQVSGVNVTIGLPIVRTSVDHGTAFDIAGEGVASDRSLRQAVSVATEMAASRTDDAKSTDGAERGGPE